VAESWSLGNGPDDIAAGENPPQWQSITDTGSLEPSPEAAVWAQRADQWAQQPDVPAQQGQHGQVSRWSGVVPTGHLPADGVGWRTETAEWRATSARWRQTTEWRSNTGTHGWRSTTEAWQTGDADAEGFVPPAGPPSGGPLAISGTSWFGDTAHDQLGSTQPGIAREPWQQADGSYPNESYPPPAAAGPPPPAAAGPPPAGTRPDWQQSTTPAAPWQQPVPAPPWQQTSDPAWQQAASSPPPWEQQAPAGDAPRRQFMQPDDGRHLVRDDDRAQWRESAAGAAGVPDRDERTRQIGRRRAPEGGEARPGGGTGWSTRSDSDNWAGHTDTGSMPLFPEAGPADGTAWRDRPEAPNWRPEGRAETASPDWHTRTGSSSWDDAPPRRRETSADAPPRRPETWADAPPRRPETWAETPPRRPEPGGEAMPRRSGSWGAAPARPAESGAPTWRTDTGTSWHHDDDGRRQRRDDAEAPDWRRDRGDHRGEGELDHRREPERDDYRGEPDSGSWSRGDEPRTDGWRRAPAAEPQPWRRHEETRRGEPAADPWAHSTSDTGVIPASWQQPTTDTGSWRTPAPEPEPPRLDPYGRRREVERYEDPYGRRAEIEAAPYAPARRRAETETAPDNDWADNDWADDQDEPLDPAVWRPDPEPQPDRQNWRMEPLADARPQSWRRGLQQDRELQQEQEPPAGAAATEIRQPIDWEQAEREQAARGSATYRAGNTGDWRRDLAADGDLADGQSQRYGTSDFVPFKPSGTASVPTVRPAVRQQSVGRVEEAARPAGPRWQDPPDTQWPPRPVTGYEGAATGSYERRPVSTLPPASGRQNNLLEPYEDEIADSTGGPLAAVGYTVIWYGVPVVLFVLYMLVLSGGQRAHALSTLAGAAPQFGLSLLLSMLVAVGLRWANGSWKAASVGLAAAVMGGGLATVLTSAITGNSLS
jgi:hypothetical protein